MINRSIAIFITVLLLISQTAGVAVGSVPLGNSDERSNKSLGRQLIVVMDRISVNDITVDLMPNTVQLISEGAMGLMNTNALGQRIPDNTYISIANGQRTGGGQWSGQFYPAHSKVTVTPIGDTRENMQAGALYRSLTGWSYPKDSVVNPGIIDLIKVNESLNYPVQVGALGESLRQAGIGAAVVGNADTKEVRRFAANLVMDHRGQVVNGIVDEQVNIKDGSFPNGIRTDYEAIYKYTTKLMDDNPMVVVDLGDVSRLDELYGEIRLQHYYQVRNQSLQRMDAFVGRLMSELDFRRDRLIILVPTPGLLELKNDNLVTPLIAVGQGFVPGGLLTSGSTRRNGLVANSDVAPTILDFYGVTQPETMIGRPMTAIDELASGKSLEYLKEVNGQLVTTYIQRPVLLRSTAVFEIIAIIGSLLVLIFAQRKQWFIWFRHLAFCFLIIPVIMLYFRFIQFNSLGLSILAILLVLVLVYNVIHRAKVSDATKLAIVSGLASLSLLIDTWLGANLIMRSPLGYDPMLGSRYYGIGNEFTGILMGSTLLALAGLNEKLGSGSKRQWWNVAMGLYMAFVTYVLFAPSLGADAGGVITALVSFGYFIMMVNNKKLNLWRVLLIGCGTLIVLFGGALWDMNFNQGQQSHIGQAMGQLVQGGWEPAWQIIQRKVAMNWKLMQYSIWSRVLLATIVGLAFFLYHPKGVFHRVQQQNPFVFKGIQAVIVATLIGFIVNDSGVVQAATTSVYLIFPLIYLALGERLKSRMSIE